MEALLQSGLQSGLFFGAEVLVAKGGNVQTHKVYGTNDGTRVLEKNAVFDVASLTKPVVTASLLIKLGLPLEGKVSQYIPRYTGGGKEAVTLCHLAAHLSGLPPTQRFIARRKTPEETFEALLSVPLETLPGEAVSYSCLGYMLLGKVLEAHTGQPLQQLFEAHIATPAGMLDSGFLPLQNGIDPRRLVPSGNRPHNSGQLGVVNDSNAWLMGGVSGNAGLFSTAPDLHRFAQWILSRPMQPMFENQSPKGLVARSIGFEVQAPAHLASCGPDFPASAIGHTGFTGTSIWIDPKSELISILLCNRTAKSQRGNKEAFRQFRADFYASHCLKA